MQQRGKAWNHHLREMTSDFISAAIESRNEAALQWLLQRAIVGLLLVGVEPDLIRRRVKSWLKRR